MSKRKRKAWVRNCRDGDKLTVTYRGKRRGRIVVILPEGGVLELDTPPKAGKNTK